MIRIKMVIPLLGMIVFMSGCMSLMQDYNPKNLEEGQRITEEDVYITGRISIDIPENNIPPARYNNVTLGLERINSEDKITQKLITVEMNESFFKKLPKGEYLVRSLSYNIVKAPIDGAGIALIPVNIVIEEVKLDLKDRDFVYVGDLNFSSRINAYGNVQRTFGITDNSSTYRELTENWVLDDKGNSIAAANLSSAFSPLMMLEESFPTTLNGYNVKTKESQYLEPAEGYELSISPSAKIAFLSVDNNYATREIVKQMEDYSLDAYDIQVVDQDSIQTQLPEYPSMIYVDNFEYTDKKFDQFYSSETYDESFDEKALRIARELDVEYLYILYHINGISFDTNNRTFPIEGLVINVRGRLFSTKDNSCIADSLIFEREELPVLSLKTYGEKHRITEELIYKNISTGIVDKLF